MNRLSVSIRRKCFAGTPAPVLQDLEFAANAGEILAVVGPSGAGKTTLLNIVAGLDRDCDGAVVIEDDTGGGRAPASAARVGYMFQTPRLMPWLSVLDNLLLVLEPSARSNDHAIELLARVGLADYANAYPRALSGGMQRRVALTRAFAVHPELMLLDEPFVSLDAPTVARLGDELLGLWSVERPIVLLVTHNLREALAFGDRVLFLSNRPARIVLDKAISLPRPRALESRPVAQLHDRLLDENPDLLSGLVRDLG